jgi:hypothetical protein
MVDEVDRADQEVEHALARALSKRRPEGPAANGYCHYCDEPVADWMRWCDIDCREAWEALMRRRS